MTQSSAAEAAGVREATVRKESKRLRKVLKEPLGRPPRKKKYGLHEFEVSQSTGVEVFGTSTSGMTERSPTEKSEVVDSCRV